jgi:two-component system sensor histidine kinase KdpD
LGAAALERDDKARLRLSLDTIRGQAEQMTGMVQDLLQLSRVAAAPLQRNRQALGHSVEAALAQLRLAPPTAAALQRVQLQVQPLPECEVDADLMRLVFVNLLGNALKFTAARAGAGRVSVDLRRSPQGAAVCVEDDGLGLPPGRDAELFKPFARLHGPLVPGVGVGLTLVRRIVEAHGGRIWAERVEGGGARFLFTLDGLTA